MNGEATRFKIGNKAAEKWTEDEAGEVFYNMLNNAEKNNDILSLQDAILSVKLYPSSLNYLLNKFPVFKNIKNDIEEIIIARLNKGGLKGDFVPTIVIWRSKQLGERDEKIVDNKSSDGSMSPKNNLSNLTDEEMMIFGKLRKKANGLND